jgi:hypothetical protein
MKKYAVIFLFILVTGFIILAECTYKKDKDSNNFMQFDVSATYQEKDIILEDVASVEYVQIVVNEDFLFNSTPHLIASDKIFISQSNGDILVFSRDGIPLTKFNRKGSGPEDYSIIGNLIYDEQMDDLYVKSINKILIYSSAGKFKRILSLFENSYINEIVDFDEKSLLLYDNYNKYPTRFSLISKEDGSVVRTINMPIDKNIDLFVTLQQGIDMIIRFYAPAHHIVQYNDGFLLTNYSIDTVYFFSREKVLSPIILRKPNIQSMEPKLILNGFIEANNYQFFYTALIKVEDRKIPTLYLMRDKNTGSIYRQKITLNDYKGKTVSLSPETIVKTNDSRLGLIILSLVELQDANKENKLRGKLKELVENSEDDGNDVFMFLNFK